MAYETREIDVTLNEVVNAEGREAFLDLIEELFCAGDEQTTRALSDISYCAVAVTPEGLIRLLVTADREARDEEDPEEEEMYYATYQEPQRADAMMHDAVQGLNATRTPATLDTILATCLMLRMAADVHDAAGAWQGLVFPDGSTTLR